jgi:hypothetical protein
VLTGAALRHIVGLPTDTVPARVAATLKRFGWSLGWICLMRAIASSTAFFMPIPFRA